MKLWTTYLIVTAVFALLFVATVTLPYLVGALVFAALALVALKDGL